jgi:hypothetical protein
MSEMFHKCNSTLYELHNNFYVPGKERDEKPLETAADSYLTNNTVLKGSCGFCQLSNSDSTKR